MLYLTAICLYVIEVIFFLEITNNFEGCQKNTLNNTKANSMEFKFR